MIPTTRRRTLTLAAPEAPGRPAHVSAASGLVRAGSAGAALLGELEYDVRAAVTLTFGGGTNEIQRELIAQFGLGMPRSR